MAKKNSKPAIKEDLIEDEIVQVKVFPAQIEPELPQLRCTKNKRRKGEYGPGFQKALKNKKAMKYSRNNKGPPKVNYSRIQRKKVNESNNILNAKSLSEMTGETIDPSISVVIKKNSLCICNEGKLTSIHNDLESVLNSLCGTDNIVKREPLQKFYTDQKSNDTILRKFIEQIDSKSKRGQYKKNVKEFFRFIDLENIHIKTVNEKSIDQFKESLSCDQEIDEKISSIRLFLSFYEKIDDIG